MEMLRIFVSGTMVNMKPERDAVAHAIASLRLDPVRAETEFSEDRPSREKCLEMARECDIYIGLYNQTRYGWGIPQDGISVTELEFDEAQHLHKPTLIFVKQLPKDWQPANDEEKEQREKQKAFLNRVFDFDKGKFRAPEFETLTQLEEQVAGSLMTLLVQHSKFPAPNGFVPVESSEEYPIPSCLNFYLKAPLARFHGILKDRLSSASAIVAFICALFIYAGGIFAFRIYQGTPLPSSLSDIFLRIAPGENFYYPDWNAIAFDFILNPFGVVLSIFYHQAIYSQLANLFKIGVLKVEDKWNQRLSSRLWVRTAVALPTILGVSVILCSWFSRYVYYIYDLMSFRLYVLLLIGISTFLRTSLLISMAHSTMLMSSSEINIPLDVLNPAAKRKYQDLGDSCLLLNFGALVILFYGATTIYTSIAKGVPWLFDFLFWEAVIHLIAVLLILIYFNHWQCYVAAYIRELKEKYIEERLGNEPDASKYQAVLALVDYIPNLPMKSSLKYHWPELVPVFVNLLLPLALWTLGQITR